MRNIASKLKFDASGLIPAVVQDFRDGCVLMVAYMNKEAVDRTIRTRIATFWSRSRNKFWIKGEESGNTQKVKEIRVDCDGDCILLTVEQVGGAACHEGYRSCFFRTVRPRGLVVTGTRVFDPRVVYSASTRRAHAAAPNKKK